MTKLTYAVLTDPTSLEASQPGRSPSTGTLYLVVTNTTKQIVNWDRIEVSVPVGNGANDLTPDVGTIKPSGLDLTSVSSPSQPGVKFVRIGTSNRFRATSSSGGVFHTDHCLVLKLENITIAAAAGPVVVKVTEQLQGPSTTTPPPPPSPSHTLMVLVKTAPQPIPAPRDFRPDKVMLEPADSTLTLRWDGSDDFDYEITYPGGASGTIPKPPKGSYLWSLPAPTRATTYTLKATSKKNIKPPQEHFLTTTVQVRHPVLETLTVTTGIDTPWVQGPPKAAAKGRLTFTGTGVEVSDNIGVKGTVTADQADLKAVTTERVQGKGANDGWIGFRKEGVTVYRDNGSNQGTVYADQADFTGVTTQWVRVSDGVTTPWVAGPGGDGAFTFAKGAMYIRREVGSDERGSLDVGDLHIERNLTIDGELTVSDLTVTKNGQKKLSTAGNFALNVHGDSQFHGLLNANADLTVRNEAAGQQKLTTVSDDHQLVVHGSSLFLGKLNANRELSVRNHPGVQIMHVNEGQVVIACDLRVHGAVRAD